VVRVGEGVEEVEVGFCSSDGCANVCIPKQFLKSPRELLLERSKDVREKEVARMVASGFNPEEEFSMSYPELHKAWEEFNDGLYTLDDGTQDGLLSSISQQISRFWKVSSSQEHAFRARCNHYAGIRREGRSYERTGTDVEDIIALSLDNIGVLNERESEMLLSFESFFAQRGYLTIKQFLALERMKDRHGW
jgi:hypothetical protein